jgi:uroporphyrinogen-III decarboxylase
MRRQKEIAKESWTLAPLRREELGRYGDFPRLTDAGKRDVWSAYRAGKPRRVPVTLGLNNRIFIQAPDLNTEGLSYREIFSDPMAMLVAQLRTAYLIRMRHALFHDADASMPEEWRVAAHYQNVYEAAFLGCPVQFREGEVPDTVPAYAGSRKRAVFDVDIGHPEAKGFIAEGLAMTRRMEEAAEGITFFGRPVVVEPYLPIGSDGPLTVAMNVRGPEILTDLIDDPGYTDELFDFIVTAAVTRARAFSACRGVSVQPDEELWFADDSISLLSVGQYRSSVLPWHRKWYDALDPDRSRKRCIHLCGNAQRHFPVIRGELGVSGFDTGFPVDFARLRDELGPEVEIMGGVEVATLLTATPEAVFQRARDILSSGIMRGGRFILREANNLPPSVPYANLAALYAAAFRFGAYPPAA